MCCIGYRTVLAGEGVWLLNSVVGCGSCGSGAVIHEAMWSMCVAVVVCLGGGEVGVCRDHAAK
ncbi:MAG TPA: hypothetical protein ACQGQH_02095 [Xylella sp.]